MGIKIFDVDGRESANKIAYSTIGFIKFLDRENLEDGMNAGSGTLVKIGGCCGVLTAAHVLHDLRDEKEIGVVQFHDLSPKYQRLIVRVEHTDRLLLMGLGNPACPDLGFLKLPPSTIASLDATAVFHNLDLRRDDALREGPRTIDCASAAIGIVAERTTDVLLEGGKQRATKFTGLFADGDLVEMPSSGDFDYLQLTPVNRTEFHMPQSFGGMSGGGLWQIHFEMVGDKPEPVGERLLGVPFFQEREGETVPTIICHGPKSIYGRLYEEVQKRWPS